MKRYSRLYLFLLILIFAPRLIGDSSARGDEGHPVAIRFWPSGAASIETMWNLHVGFRTVGIALPREADLQLASGKGIPDASESHQSKPVHWWTEGPREFALDRKPDQPESTWAAVTGASELSSSAIRISLVMQIDGAGLTVVAVDGVRILDTGGMPAGLVLSALKTDDAAMNQVDHIDAILVTSAELSAEDLSSLASALHPRVIVIPGSAGIMEVAGEPVRQVSHNTMAISAALDEEEARTKVSYVSLGARPYEMSQELADLYEKKEKACRDSRELFADLSIEQMNFVPGDGTHTPRWNAEHMMGRELLFFSQIFDAVDPAIAVIDLNPGQMPDDYRAAHPDWTGAEEARQMERVEAFTRRFAYLLEGMDLDERAPGSRFWTPRALLKQMDRHYSEHTGNVRRKMELPNWPQN